MDPINTITHVCVVCAEPATTLCSGCTDMSDMTRFNLTPTRYCGKDCQKRDWPLHKESCKAVQARIKLFRASELLQEVFFATRAETFDMPFTHVNVDPDGMINIFGSASNYPIRPLQPLPSYSVSIQHALLSCSAGGDVFSGLMFELCKRTFKGCVTKVEEAGLSLFNARVKFNATLPKDGSTWAVDLAGAQHGQFKPTMPFADYSRDYCAKIVGSRPFGSSSRNPEISFSRRYPDKPLTIIQLIENQGHQVNELAKWEYHHLTVQEVLKAKVDRFQTLKKELVEHLATAAREYVKLAMNDPGSKARLILVSNTGNENMSGEDKGRMERKRARKEAGMDAATREMYEQHKVNGVEIVMI